MRERLRLQSWRSCLHIGNIDTTGFAKRESGERKESNRYTLGNCLQSGKSEVNKKQKRSQIGKNPKEYEEENQILKC